MKIEYAPRYKKRLEAIADFIYTESGSRQTTRTYIQKLRSYVRQTLSAFPEAGRAADEYGANIRKLVFRGYSILYRFDKKAELIEVLTIYRENLP